MIQLGSAGRELKMIRQEKNLSLNQLASRLDWDKGRLSRYENNKVALSTESIEKIAEALGIPATQLVIRLLKGIYPEFSDSSNSVGKLFNKLYKATSS